MTPSELKREAISQLTDAAMRINLESDMACWVTISGHVGKIEITVAKTKKDHYLDKITTHEFYYDREWGSKEEADAEFFTWAKDTQDALTSVLSKSWTKKFKAHCNLIDMSCSQVFVSEAEAKRWVKKMKSKYDKVHAIVGYKEELV